MSNWKSVPAADIPQMPAMLGFEEMQFLYWWMREKFTGAGLILDVGTFLGASAACMAKGLDENQISPPESRKIYGFDFFRYDSAFYGSYIADRQIKNGDNTVPIVKELLGEKGS